MNLHKTFSTPHGGGGPGCGPCCCTAELEPFLPKPQIVKDGDTYKLDHDRPDSIGRVKAFYGNFGMMVRALAYIQTHGDTGLKEATEAAVLNARYLSHYLKEDFHKPFEADPMHEVILSHKYQTRKGVHTLDIAKRLIDCGFHAPTMSWPVAGTLMIEPTESETKAELDRFCDAMLAIRAEITQVEVGELDAGNNPLKNAPHTMEDLVRDWDRPYTRETGCFPPGAFRVDKYWPPVNRVDNVFGDRNLVCSCPPMESYKD